MNNLKKIAFTVSTSIFLALSFNILIAEITSLQAQAQTEINNGGFGGGSNFGGAGGGSYKSQSSESNYLSSNVNNDNLAYFQGEKWNIAIPIATVGVFSTILGMLTMMLIESRLKTRNNSYKR